MAPINISAITFIPSMEFTFGSFNFIASVDGRLHVSNLEATLIDQITPDPIDRILTDSETVPYCPGTSSDSVIQLTCFNACLARLWKINPNTLRATLVEWPVLADRPTMNAE